MAVKCFRQALQSLKESSLSDNQKTLKSHEITAIIKELRTVHGFNLAFEGADASERQGCQVSEKSIGWADRIVDRKRKINYAVLFLRA